MFLKFIETLQFRLIFKILLLNGRAHFILDNDTPIMYRFSPRSQASLEEKRVSVQKLPLILLVGAFFTFVKDTLIRYKFIFSLRMAKTLATGSGRKFGSCPRSKGSIVEHSVITNRKFVVHFLIYYYSKIHYLSIENSFIKHITRDLIDSQLN